MFIATTLRHEGSSVRISVHFPILVNDITSGSSLIVYHTLYNILLYCITDGQYSHIHIHTHVVEWCHFAEVEVPRKVVLCWG